MTFQLELEKKTTKEISSCTFTQAYELNNKRKPTPSCRTNALATLAINQFTSVPPHWAYDKAGSFDNGAKCAPPLLKRRHLAKTPRCATLQPVCRLQIIGTDITFGISHTRSITTLIMQTLSALQYHEICTRMQGQVSKMAACIHKNETWCILAIVES